MQTDMEAQAPPIDGAPMEEEAASAMEEAPMAAAEEAAPASMEMSPSVTGVTVYDRSMKRPGQQPDSYLVTRLSLQVDFCGL